MSSVWVQVYYEDVESGDSFEVEPVPTNISRLKEAVKSKRPNALSHCDAADLVVYPLGTAVPIQDGVDALPSRTKLATLNLTEEDTLIVVAPAPKQADGKKSFGFGCWFIVEFIHVVLT